MALDYVLDQVTTLEDFLVLIIVDFQAEEQQSDSYNYSKLAMKFQPAFNVIFKWLTAATETRSDKGEIASYR